MLIPNGTKSVCRGKHHKSLVQKKIQIFRTMSASEVKRAIMKSFTLLSLSFIYLDVDTAHKFSEDTVQEKHGNAVADCGKYGTVYIMEHSNVST